MVFRMSKIVTHKKQHVLVIEEKEAFLFFIFDNTAESNYTVLLKNIFYHQKEDTSMPKNF